MADKKSKKPRHQNLFVPGDSKPKKGKAKTSKAPARGHSYTAPARPKSPAAETAPGGDSSSHQEALRAEADRAPVDLFGGEAQVEEAVAAGKSAAPAGAGPHAGEALTQGGMFDDDDGMVLSAVAPPPKRLAPAPRGNAKAPKGKRARLAGKGKKKPNAMDELRGADPWDKPAEGVPDNTVLMPQKKKKTRLTAAKRRKLWKRARRVAVLAAAAVVVLVYATGAYRTLATIMAEGFDSVRISLQGGDGFPAEFGLSGYLKAEPMGESAMVALGGSEAAIFASNGTQLRYLQHGYLNPGVATGKNRAVLYSRGGKEYTVETRSKTAAKNTTDQEISFCAMSPDGVLGVVTSSRYRANLQVLAPPYDSADPLFNWPLVDEEPVALTFQADNKAMVLACLSNQDGALGTTLYMLRTDRDAVQVYVRADNATLLQLRYLENHRVLAVYDTYAATYNSRGEELNRYDYAHRRLITANIHDGRVGLVFGTTTREAVHTVLLDKSLEPQFDVAAGVIGSPRVLVTSGGVYLMSGQTLYAYTNRGALAARTDYETKLLGLAYAGAPLLVQQGQLTPVGDQLSEAPVEAAPSRLPASAGAPQSVPLPASVPEGLYESRPPDSGEEISSLAEEGEEEDGGEGEGAVKDDPPPAGEDAA